MYVHEISIEIKSNYNKRELEIQFDHLMHYYRGSGQSLGRYECGYIDKNRIVSIPVTHEKNSLDKKYNNYYVNKQILRLEELCKSVLEIKTIGTAYRGIKATCKCKTPEFYILNAMFSSLITCGTCYRAIPLYKLPIYYDYGYMPILSWETNYISCDSLQMNCEVGERWALNQMQKIDSQLNKQGLKICRKLEEITSIPTYYFLYDYKKYKGKQQLESLCPGCNNKWILKTQLHENFDFKCETCRLLSSFSNNRG